MSASNRVRPFPRGALLGAGALVVLAIGLTGFTRISGIGATHAPTAAAVAIRDLRFEDRNDGAVTVYDAHSEQIVDVLASGTNGFVRGVLRGLVRDRKREDISSEPPFRLTRWADNRLSLQDMATGQSIELESFGPTNELAFARLLNDRSASR
jgi:putative photosynthetic complex assembly protein